jgi:hypothetical protein
LSVITIIKLFFFEILLKNPLKLTEAKNAKRSIDSPKLFIINLSYNNQSFHYN